MDEKKEEKKIEKINVCPICCEMFTKHLRKEICCSYCNYSCCSVCFKTFILSKMSEPNCMNCKKRVSREIISDNFSKKFLQTEYKHHRENLLFEQEMAMMPSTQNIIELKNEVTNLHNQIGDLNSQIAELENQRNKIYRNIDRYNNIYNHPALYYRNQDKKEEKQSSTFIKPCPGNNCRGFLSTRYMCGICNIKVCPQCHEVKSETKNSENKEEHKCNPANIESVKLIKSDTKACPKCGVYIYKISGCFDGDTKILMYNDTIKYAKDIQIGDVIQGMNKTPKVVMEIFTGKDKMFKIHHHDLQHFENYIVNSKHELVLKYIHHKSLTMDSTNKICVKWYDKNTKLFHKKEIENADKKIYQEVQNELDFINNDDIVIITVDDYLKLDEDVKNVLFAVSDRKFYCAISVENLQEGVYYGFKLSQDPFFILPSGTVVSNCSQIWCTSCKTAFDWKSGNIINGPVHNPHYFEYLRSIGQEDEEIQRRYNNGIQGINCLNWNQLSSLAEHFRKVDSVEHHYFINDIFNLSRHINHIRDYVLNTELANHYNNPEEVNADLRVQYLQNYVSKDTFKIKIQRRDKKNSYNQHMREVVEMYSDVLTDTLVNFNNRVQQEIETLKDTGKESNKEDDKEYKKKWSEIKREFIKEIHNLNQYTRKNTEKIMNDYSYTSIPMFLFNLHVI